MQKNIILLENIRSAYNVGNIIRTADALGRNVWLSGYTPHPSEQPKVKKTSLGAEDTTGIERFDNALDAIQKVRELGYMVLAGELDNRAVALDAFSENLKTNDKNTQNKLIILGNEVDGVLNSTMDVVDDIVYIPMNGVKESMNVGQSAAIFMWELRN